MVQGVKVERATVRTTLTPWAAAARLCLGRWQTGWEHPHPRRAGTRLRGPAIPESERPRRRHVLSYGCARRVADRPARCRPAAFGRPQPWRTCLLSTKRLAVCKTHSCSPVMWWHRPGEGCRAGRVGYRVRSGASALATSARIGDHLGQCGGAGPGPGRRGPKAGAKPRVPSPAPARCAGWWCASPVWGLDAAGQRFGWPAGQYHLIRSREATDHRPKASVIAGCGGWGSCRPRGRVVVFISSEVRHG